MINFPLVAEDDYGLATFINKNDFVHWNFVYFTKYRYPYNVLKPQIEPREFTIEELKKIQIYYKVLYG